MELVYRDIIKNISTELHFYQMVFTEDDEEDDDLFRYRQEDRAYFNQMKGYRWGIKSRICVTTQGPYGVSSLRVKKMTIKLGEESVEIEPFQDSLVNTEHGDIQLIVCDAHADKRYEFTQRFYRYRVDGKEGIDESFWRKCHGVVGYPLIQENAVGPIRTVMDIDWTTGTSRVHSDKVESIWSWKNLDKEQSEPGKLVYLATNSTIAI